MNMGRTARASFAVSSAAIVLVLSVVGLTGCNTQQTGNDIVKVKQVKLPTGQVVDCVVLYEDSAKAGAPDEPSGIDCDWSNKK